MSIHEAALRRSQGVAQRADRPQGRRAAEDPNSGKPRPAWALTRAEVREADDGGLLTFHGIASRTEVGYSVWDIFGEYTEVIDAAAFDETLRQADLDVPLVLGHDSLRRIARTINGTLRLASTDDGLDVLADLDPCDADVAYIAPKIRAGLVDEMSFMFRIEAGEWSPDYTEYRVTRVNLHRGDVSIVGYGANPHTLSEIPARSDAVAGTEARTESSSADALGDDRPAEPTSTTERSAVMDDATVKRAAEVVESTIEVREDATPDLEARIADLEDQIRIRSNAEEAQRTMPNTPAYDQVARVTAEPRTYTRESDRTGRQFISDVVRNHLGDGFDARERLARHMQEERVERGHMIERAAGTTAFAGLVVPQYLVDLVAPAAKAGRPFADAVRALPLPEQGMTVELSRITTATTTAVQTQGSAVSEQDMDDTALSVAVQTIGGSQTVTRQAVERGSSVLDTVLEDLMRSYATTLDSTMLNQATNGLTNVATSIAYTDASPTAAELYPKLLQATAAVEAALIDQQAGDTIAVMHSRRWYWLQSQLSSTFPLFQQPNVAFNVAGVNFGERYGSGFRGVLPSGVPVIVDNNISTAFGTNEDEIYFVGANDIFLWEDPNAPMLIRTDTGPSIKSLGVDVVVYGYAAYTHVRRAHAQKIAGTGLILPTWA